MGDRGAAARVRRGLERSDALPDPPAPPPPRPAPEPQWKKELQERLSGYRESGVLPPPRKQDPLPPLRSAAPPLPERPPGGKPPVLPPPRRSAEAIEAPAPQDDPPPPIVDLRPADRDGDEGRPLTTSGQPAPLSVRAIAGAMDLGVALLATGLFVGVLHQIELVALSPEETVRVTAAAFALNLSFYLFCFLLYAGRTAGMSWLGLSVLNLDGEPPASSQRRSRAFGTLLSLAALGIGFIWAAADEQGLTWHDRMSKTFVAQD